MNRLHRLAASCATGIVLCVPAFGAQAGDSWRSTLKPYFWAAGISGDVEIGSLPSQDVDVSFGEIMEHFDIGGMLGFEVRKGDGDVAYLADLLYIDLEDDRTNADAELTEFMGEVDVAFRPWEPKWLELLAGLRYWNVDAEVDPTGPAQASKSADWIDPVLGARATFHPFSERWTSQWRADGGGFGVGSEWTYQLSGDLQYAFSESLSGTLGYRVLDFDYEGSSGDFDLAMHGPWVGVNWSF